MREAEFNWVANHPEIFKKYRGEYVAIIGKKVIAHGKHLKQVIKKAEKIEKEPLTAYIPKEDVLVV